MERSDGSGQRGIFHPAMIRDEDEPVEGFWRVCRKCGDHDKSLFPTARDVDLRDSAGQFISSDLLYFKG